MNEMTVKDVLRIMLKNIWVVTAVPFVTIVAATLIVYFVMVPVYTASTTLYVLNRQTESSVTSADLQSSQLLTADYRELALSKRVLGAVASRFELDADKLSSEYSLQVTAANNTRVIQISATAESPVLAANLANAIGQEFSVCVVEIMDANNVSVVDAAVPPVAPSAPKKAQTVAMAAAAALLVAVGIVMLKEMLNTTIRTGEDVEKMLGLPILAKIPKIEAR